MSEPESIPKGPITIISVAKLLRERSLDLEDRVRDLMKHPFFAKAQDRDGQHGEVGANIMLSVRHLEDARMRLGKVCQYADDGVSIFDKPPLTGPKGTVDIQDVKMEAVIGATGQAPDKLPPVGVEAALTRPSPTGRGAGEAPPLPDHLATPRI